VENNMPPIPPEQQSPYDAGPTPVLAHSIPDVCRKTSLGRTALYEEIKAGRLKACKAGRRTVVLDSDLRAWLVSLPQINGAA
jgi:predicted DNA-binding transcriptional regulator AlpA